MIIRNDKEKKAIRDSGAILHDVIVGIEKASFVGVNLLELDELAGRLVKSAGAKCPFLGYKGFPSNICLSVNDGVVHGIPYDYVLRQGDILGIDMGVLYDDAITDSAITVGIGDIGDKELDFLRTTKEALGKAIGIVKDGVRVGDIGAVIQQHVEAAGYGIVRELTGHGVGRALHEDPHIPNYGTRGTGPTLHSGEVIAIEPITTMGRYAIYVDRDDWTIRTRDGSTGAQFEHTLIVTDRGAEVVT